jgi:hypothetical protein
LLSSLFCSLLLFEHFQDALGGAMQAIVARWEHRCVDQETLQTERLRAVHGAEPSCENEKVLALSG